MRKRCFFTFIIALLTTIRALAQSAFSGGAGTVDNPFLISNQADLELLANDVNSRANNYSGKYLKLTQDVQLSDGTNWQPIGGDSCVFSGIFDGNGHKITNLFISRPTTNNIGFFGIVSGKGTTIQNIGIEIAPGGVNGNQFVGGLAGSNLGTISNCYTKGDVEGDEMVGGLVGYNIFIRNCYASSNVEGNKSVGGLVGINFVYINNCFASGNVEGKDHVGGLVGTSVIGTTNNCYYSSNNAKGIGFSRSDFEETNTVDTTVIPVSLAKMVTEGLSVMKNLTKDVGNDQWNNGNDNYLPAPKPFKNASKIDIVNDFY
ncbi:hypothetical protein AGMMS50239_26790 [Bacteroidia bacterium]|nr:hypothetical protein AGMMS50239_26790 [Bacteroidia bacterium]GHV31762.1 hypothetical protein FACS1894177_06930 [Bacteroidia bacterium]